MSQRSYNDKQELHNLLEDLKRYRKYESFTRTPGHPDGHAVYDDIFEKTASGLIYDAVAKTSQLNMAERAKHKYAQEVFAAFCMHYCVLALSDPSKYCNVGKDIVMEVSEMIIRKLMKYLMGRLQKGEPITFLRKSVISWARQVNIEIFKRDHRKDQETGIWHPKLGERHSLEADVEYEDGSRDETNRLVVEFIMQKAEEQMRKEKLIADMGDLLEECRREHMLSAEEVEIICYSFGLGDGYETLNQNEIAKELGRNASYVSRHLSSALERMAEVINTNDSFSHLRRLCSQKGR